MATSVFLGLDFGTSGARACIIAKNGEIEEFTRLNIGRLEDFEMVASWRDALFDLLAGLPIGLRKHLSAIAIDGTSATILSCDEELNPTHVPLLYNDARARSESEAIARVASKSHPAASATSGLAKVLWLQQRLKTANNYLFLNQADWLTGLLSGRPGISDYHNTLKMGFEPGQSTWPDWVAQLVDLNSMPSVVMPGSPIGLLSGSRSRDLNIQHDCLIRAGTTDSIAAFLAADLDQPGEAVTSLGTTLVLKQISERQIDDARLGIYSHWFGRLWLAGGASNAGGGVLRQYFSDQELSKLSNQFNPNTDSGLEYYPLPCPGERFPINDPDLMPRLTPKPEDPAHFLHGLLEGLANIEARGYAKLTELGATPLTRVLSSGGGASNPAYSQIREHRLRVPVSIAPYQEAAYGSALLARMALVFFREYVMTEDGLIVEADLPFSWERGTSGPTQEQGNRLLLRVVNLLDVHDPDPSKTSERLEAKLDLMLHWLGTQLFGEATNQRMTPLRLSRDLIEWNDVDVAVDTGTIVMKIGIHPTIPGPLRITGQMLENDNGHIRVQPVFPDEAQEDAWGQWLFRLHRRTVHEARLKSESA